jgi:hypothetical protein
VAIAFLPYVGAALDTLSTGIATLREELAGVGVPPEVGAAIEHATQGLQAWVSASLSELAGVIANVATPGLSTAPSG